MSDLPTCIGKTQLYFRADENQVECAAPWLTLKAFWYWHPSGNLDARICFVHRELFLSREHRGGLYEAISRHARKLALPDEGRSRT